LPAGWKRYSARWRGRPQEKDVSGALESILGVLGLKILVIEDDAVTARTIALRKPVDRANQRFGNVGCISATVLAKPSQAASPPLLTVVSGKRPARGGKYS
jgi:hypothetical protein